MNTLDASDILADVESYLSATPAGLDFERMVQIAALAIEVSAHVKMLQQSAAMKGNAHIACTYLERAAADLLAMLDNDQVAEQALELLEALPAGGRRQAVTAYLGGAQ